MSTASAALPLERPKDYQIILYAGLLAGVLDITAAFVTWGVRGVSPIRILHSIASGLLGAEARNGGLKTAALGLVLHFIIATGAAAVFYLASRMFKFLLQWFVLCGLLYGVAVYVFMNSVVLPLSAVKSKGYPAWPEIMLGLIVHMLCVGLPIALVVNYYSKDAAHGNGGI